jgi:hypothetical protein
MKGFLLGFSAFCFGILAFVMLCIATVQSVYAYNVRVTSCEVIEHNYPCRGPYFGFCYRVDCLSKLEGRDVTWCTTSSRGYNLTEWPIGKKFECSYWETDYYHGYVLTFTDWKRYWLYFAVSIFMFTWFWVWWIITEDNEPVKLKRH